MHANKHGKQQRSLIPALKEIREISVQVLQVIIITHPTLNCMANLQGEKKTVQIVSTEFTLYLYNLYLFYCYANKLPSPRLSSSFPTHTVPPAVKANRHQIKTMYK